MNPRILGVGLAAGALVLDQGTKAVALATPDLHAGVKVLPIFNLVLVSNDGVSFGLLGGTVPWWTLVVMSIAIVTALLVWLWHSHDRLLAAGLGLIVGGALGNVVDRVRIGAVTDFLDFHVGGYHWPTFNIADVAVVGGACLVILDSLRSSGSTELDNP